jgi:hypothetical protein
MDISIRFIAYSPSNAIWWETYAISQSLFSKFYQKDKFHGEILLFFQATIGFITGAPASAFNQPFDVINTSIGFQPTFARLCSSCCVLLMENI